MCNIYLRRVLKSHYCKIVFALTFVVGLVTVPKSVYLDRLSKILVYIFIALFALTATCLVRNIKERVVAARARQSSILGIVATAIGIVAIQSCGIGAPICGASVGAGFLGFLFPGMALSFFRNYASILLISSIAVQIVSLYLMNCLKKLR
jgi:hypothetical protein